VSSPGEPGPEAVAAVLFDFGGVLSSSPFEAFQRYERAHGLPAGFIRSVNAANHLDNAWARLERNELGFDEFCVVFGRETADAGTAVDARELFAMLSGELHDDMVEAVRRCGKRFKTGLLTNNFVTPLADRRVSDVLALFDVIIESTVGGLRKPDPRFYHLACDKLGIRPSQAVFLDDLGVNLKPARALGMRTIKVTDTSTAITELESVLGIPSEGVVVSNVATEQFEPDPDVPGTDVHVVYEGEGFSTGLSRATTAEGPITWTLPSREVVLVLEGAARIEIKDGPTLELRVGDVACLPAGADTTWHLTVPFKEFWVLG